LGAADNVLNCTQATVTGTGAAGTAKLRGGKPDCKCPRLGRPAPELPLPPAGEREDEDIEDGAAVGGGTGKRGNTAEEGLSQSA
jgi:hypothetical protein